MEKKKLERTILKGVEMISRREAMSCKTYPTAMAGMQDILSPAKET